MICCRSFKPHVTMAKNTTLLQESLPGHLLLLLLLLRLLLLTVPPPLKSSEADVRVPQTWEVSRFAFKALRAEITLGQTPF